MQRLLTPGWKLADYSIQLDTGMTEHSCSTKLSSTSAFCTLHCQLTVVLTAP